MRHDRGCQQKFQGTVRPAVTRACVVAIVLTLLVPPMLASGDDEDRASPGDWIYLAIVSVGAAVLVTVIIVGSHRGVNPHTGLRGRIKRRPAQGRSNAQRLPAPRRRTSAR